MKLMLRSHSNLLVSVRHVTQENRGKKTPGIDGQVALTPAQRVDLVQEMSDHTLWKAQPARRVYIPKARGKLRPLGIPVPKGLIAPWIWCTASERPTGGRKRIASMRTLAVVTRHGLAAGVRRHDRCRHSGWTTPVPERVTPRFRHPCALEGRAVEYGVEVDGTRQDGNHSHVLQRCGRRAAKPGSADVGLRIGGLARMSGSRGNNGSRAS